MKEINSLFDMTSGKKKWDDVAGIDDDIDKELNSAYGFPQQKLDENLDPLAAMMGIDSPLKSGGALNPQVQPMTTVEATPIDPPTGPIYPTQLAPEDRNPTYGENYRLNTNSALDRSLDNAHDQRTKLADREETSGLSKSALLSIAERAAEQPDPFKSSYDYDGEMEKLQKAQNIASQPDKPDLLTDLIYNLGAPLLGASGGESGAIAQRPAQQEIEKQRNFDTTVAAKQKNALSNEISKRMIGLSQMQKGEYDQYKDERNFHQAQLKQLADRVSHLADGDVNGVKEATNDLNKMESDFVKNTMTGSDKLAGMEEKPALEDQKFAHQKELAGMNNAAKITAAKNGIGSMREENAAQREFSRIAKDPTLVQIGKSQLGLKRDFHTLDAAIQSGEGVSGQTLKEISNGLASALSIGNSSAVSDRQAQEYHNLNTALAEIKSKYSFDGITPVKDPKLLGQVRDMIIRLDGAFKKNIAEKSEALRRNPRNEYLRETENKAITGVNSIGGIDAGHSDEIEKMKAELRARGHQ